jgi:rhodanese-related sulfurtransferase
MFDQILPGAFDEDIAFFCAKYLRQKGVKLVLGEKVIGIEGNGKVESVRTERQSLAADVVIVATGIRPNDKLAREAGLLCADPGGILVNEYCQTSDRDIYAGGDCVVNAYCGGIAGSSIYAPMGSTANKHGRVIANHIAGHPTPFGGITCTAIVRAFDFTIGRTGMLERQARELQMDVETFTWGGSDLPHFMPERKPFLIKMVASRRSRKLLGVQVAGMGNGSKRLDVAAGMIFMGATLDQVADIDFGYAPPYSQALDPLATCAHMLSNKLDGLASSISSVAARNRLEKGEALLLDVRTPREVKSMQMPFEFIHIPLGELRNRAAELPRDRDILIACLAGLRAYEAQRILNAAGFDRVQFFEGGLSGWPFEVIRMTRG